MIIIREAGGSMPASLKGYIAKIDEMIRRYEELREVTQNFEGFNPRSGTFEVFVRSIDFDLKDIEKSIAYAKDIVRKQGKKGA